MHARTERFSMTPGYAEPVPQGDGFTGHGACPPRALPGWPPPSFAPPAMLLRQHPAAGSPFLGEPAAKLRAEHDLPAEGEPAGQDAESGPCPAPRGGGHLCLGERHGARRWCRARRTPGRRIARREGFEAGLVDDVPVSRLAWIWRSHAEQ